MNLHQNNSFYRISCFTISFVCFFLFSGCKKEKNNNTENATYYYTATIDGIKYSQSVTATNGYEAGSGLGGVDDVVLFATINPESSPFPEGSTAMDIGKGTLHNYLSLSNEEFKAWFSPGTYGYTISSDVDGFSIDWTDKDGNYWDTQGGSGDQTNSTIKIISVKDVRSYNGYYIEVKLQFSCKLYNTDTGEMKQLTNGEFVGLFGKI